jgi:hypothetical protein
MNTSWNGSRFRREDAGGFYESYFQRGNHPDRPLAFWIRYTVFSPRGRPHEARGELWAIYFDGENGRKVAIKESVPISECRFASSQLDVQIRNSTLQHGVLHGGVQSPSHQLSWKLSYEGTDAPLLLLPESLYSRALPKAKALVGSPNAMYHGTITVDGHVIEVDAWQGSQNHNWGTRHTDSYAWAQVAGFDDAPDAFLECATARIKLGPVWSPQLTFVVLRDVDGEIALNSLLQAVRASAAWDFFTWTLDTRNADVHVSGVIQAPADAFVGLRYDNPPGGDKLCLNTKLGAAQIVVRRRGQSARTFVTKHRAAFEILTDRTDHGVEVVL